MSEEQKIIKSGMQPTLMPISGTDADSENRGTLTLIPKLDYSEHLKIEKTIRIAVSGDIFLTKLEKKIIDTPDFQRLRGVRQLGSVNVVYPTALHTRFDHCLGTLAMADQMIRAIEDNTHNKDEEKRIEPVQKILTRLYALLHDLPHVPFGHTIEDELNIFTRHDKNERRLERFFGVNSQVGRLIIESLGVDTYKRFMSIYRWDGKTSKREAISFIEKVGERRPNELETPPTLEVENDAFIYDLVSNTVCADLLDYLGRDFFFCNLGSPLEYRFLNFLYLSRDNEGLKRVFVRLWKADKPQPRRDVLTDLARLLEARYIVAERAYFHHAKIISGAMLGRAIYEANQSGELKEEDLYSHSDDTLIYQLTKSNNPIAAKLSALYLERKLHKRDHRLRYSQEDFAGVQAHDHAQNARNVALAKVADPKARTSIENQLADEIGVDYGDIIIYAPGKKMNRKEAGMKVLWKGEPNILGKIDDRVIAPRLRQILDAHDALWAIQVITSPHLTAEQVELLKLACDALLLSSGEDLERKQEYYYERLIESRLAKINANFSGPIAEYQQRKAEAARALTTTARDSRPFKEKLEAILNRFFPQQTIQGGA